MDNFDKMAPIIYTPTVGWACSHWSHLFRRPRGLYITADDKDEMVSLVYNWEHDEVDAVVVTDGSRVLGRVTRCGDLKPNFGYFWDQMTRFFCLFLTYFGHF